MTPNYNWSPKSSSPPGSANITIALIEPNYLISWDGYIPEPFYSYRESIEADFLELLTEKGFTVRGPFRSRDEMVYSDKENCEIALTLAIDPIFKTISGGWRNQLIKCDYGSYAVKFNGIVSMYGKINISALEPISGEKVWTKSVELPGGTTTEIESKLYCDSSPNLLNYMNEAGVGNPFTILLQSTYGETLTKCNNIINTEEFQKLIPQIQKLKNN
jgi:hypothetical protein